jgi:hypothetical protein
MTVLSKILTGLWTTSIVGGFLLSQVRVSSSMVLLTRMIAEITPWLCLMTLVLSINMWLTMRYRLHVVDDVVMGLVVTPMVGMAIYLMTILV